MSAQIIILPSGRPVLDTGKVLVGVRHGEPPLTPRTLAWGTPRPVLSRDAERLQAAMLSGGTSEPPAPPAEWLDDEELKLEMAQRDAEAIDYINSALDRLVAAARWIIAAVAVGLIGWLGWTA